MRISVPFEVTAAHETQLTKLARLVGRQEGDVLDTVLRDPDLSAETAEAFTQLLDKHLAEQRTRAPKQGPRPIAWPTTQKAALDAGTSKAAAGKSE